MMFLGLRKLGNICCGHKMFLNNIRNTSIGHKICVRNARGQTVKHLCRQQCVLVCQGLKNVTFCIWQEAEFALSCSKGPGKRGHILAPWCFLGCAKWETFVADTKCFWTKSETFFVSRTQNLCSQQMLHARANGETFVSATMCPRLPGP